MSPSEIRIALLGCGGVTRRYRKSYAGIAGARVVATVDVQQEEAEAAAAELGARRSSTRIEDALRDDVDAVVISTPNHLHLEHAVAALQAGKHVLLQKPMARTAKECEAILEARDRSQATLGLYMNLLDHPLFRDMRKMVKSGYLGKMALFSARLAHRGGLKWAGSDQNWRASRERTGGGSFIQLGVHYQHLMRWLLDESISAYRATGTNVACPHLEGDDLMLVQYRLAGGGLGEIQTSWCCEEEHVSLLGTQGAIHYRDNLRVEFRGENGAFHGEALQLKGDGSLEVLPELIAPDWDDSENPYNQHRRFVECLLRGDRPEVSGEDGLEDVRVVEGVYAQTEGSWQ